MIKLRRNHARYRQNSDTIKLSRREKYRVNPAEKVKNRVKNKKQEYRKENVRVSKIQKVKQYLKENSLARQRKKENLKKHRESKEVREKRNKNEIENYRKSPK